MATIHVVTVEATKPYGTLVRLDEKVLLVHAFEQSWFWPFEARRHFSVGDQLHVWIAPPLIDGGPPWLSFRRAHPENDPAGKLNVGDVLSGPITAIDADGVAVTFGRGAGADFSWKDLRQIGITAHMVHSGAILRARVAQITTHGHSVAYSLEPIGLGSS